MPADTTLEKPDLPISLEENRISGIPVGSILLRIGQADFGEWFIDNTGTVKVADFTRSTIRPIIAPNNVYGEIDLSVLELPEGWERDGELDKPEEWFRVPGFHEYVLSIDRTSAVYANEHQRHTHRRIILRSTTRRVLIIELPVSQNEIPAELASVLAGFPNVNSRIEERPVS